MTLPSRMAAGVGGPTLAGSAILCSAMSAARLAAPEPGRPRINLLKDSIDHIGETAERHALGAKVRETTRSDQVALPGINPHP